jgi:hypothetical protein
MYEYQINVSRNGRHMFRTDWENDQVRAENTFHTLTQSLPDCIVTVVSRSLERQRLDWSIKL